MAHDADWQPVSQITKRGLFGMYKYSAVGPCDRPSNSRSVRKPRDCWLVRQTTLSTPWVLFIFFLCLFCNSHCFLEQAPAPAAPPAVCFPTSRTGFRRRWPLAVKCKSSSVELGSFGNRSPGAMTPKSVLCFASLSALFAVLITSHKTPLTRAPGRISSGPWPRPPSGERNSRPARMSSTRLALTGESSLCSWLSKKETERHDRHVRRL